MQNNDVPQPLKQQGMILMSFYRVSKGTTHKVPYEELVLQLWRDFPEVFSLRNHPEHPDASDVHKKLYNGPLKNDGLIISLGNKMFRLTDKGLTQARELVASSEPSANSVTTEKIRLSREEENYYKHAHSSRSFATWQAGKHDRLVDYDARVFFQFSTGTKVEERKRKVNFAKETILKAQSIGIEGAEDLNQLVAFLLKNFSGLLQEA